MVMVFNATFNNISAISCKSVSLVEETRVPGENHTLSQVTDIILYRVHLVMSVFQVTNSVVIALITQVVVNPTTIRSQPR
jgi:hypothetical protein